MFYRSSIRILNKDNDKIIGKIWKRNYWTPEFQENKFSSSLKPHGPDFITDTEFLFHKLDRIDEKIEHLITLHKEFDYKMSKMIKNFEINKFE